MLSMGIGYSVFLSNHITEILRFFEELKILANESSPASAVRRRDAYREKRN